MEVNHDALGKIIRRREPAHDVAFLKDLFEVL